MMSLPWDDWVTATIAADGERNIVAEGPLRAIVPTLAERPLEEQLGMILAFPDRRQPPYRFDGDQIGPLALQLQTDKLVAMRNPLGFAADQAARSRSAAL